MNERNNTTTESKCKFRWTNPRRMKCEKIFLNVKSYKEEVRKNSEIHISITRINKRRGIDSIIFNKASKRRNSLLGLQLDQGGT